MLLGKKYWQKFIAIMVIFAVAFPTNATAVLAAENTNANYTVKIDDNVTINHEQINEEEGNLTFEYKNPNDDFTIHYNNSGNKDYYSETYDKDGNILYKVIQEGNSLICYDIDGNVLGKTTFSSEKISSGIEQSAISPLAYIWDDELAWVSGDTEIYNFSLKLVITIISAAITASYGIPGMIVDKAITTLAEQIIDNAIPIIYYDGWKQYGWDTGFSIIRVNVDFYRYGHYNGFLQNYNKVIPNH